MKMKDKAHPFSPRYGTVPGFLGHLSKSILTVAAFAFVSHASSQPAFAQADNEQAPIVEISAEGCDLAAPIRSAVGQSFRLPIDADLGLESISVWIGANSEAATGYELVLLHGEGPSGIRQAISSTVNLDSEEAGQEAGWQEFVFEQPLLRQGQPYTFVLASQSLDSGTFARCTDRYVDGVLHRPGDRQYPSDDMAFRIHGLPVDPTGDVTIDLPPPPEPGAPAQPILPMIAKLAAEGELGARKIVMPLGDSITDMGANINPWDWGGSAWGGYRKEMANNATFAALFQFAGSYGVTEWSTISTVSPYWPTMPADQREHCAWSGASLRGWGQPGTSITENFWKCRSITPKLDFVLLHGGSNDLRQPDVPAQTQGNAAAQAALELIQGILLNTDFSTKILVAKIIPMTGDFAGFNENVIAYNNKLESEIRFRQDYTNTANTAWYWQPRVKIVDMYAAFHNRTGNLPQNALLDGLHPNETGNQIMAYEWMAAIYANNQ